MNDMSESIETKDGTAQVFDEFKKKIVEAKFSPSMGEKHWNSI